MSSNNLDELIQQKRLLAQNSSPVYYSDLSGLQDQVGKAVVNLVTKARLEKYVGPLVLQSVYIGELVGISLALDLALDKINSYATTLILIFIHNQSAFKAINNSQGRSRQFFIEEIYTKARKLQLPSAIYWISANVRVPRNK